MLEPLIISGVAPLSNDLKDVFWLRERTCHLLSPSEVDAAASNLGNSPIVIDMSSAYAVDHRAGASFTQLDFDKMLDLCATRDWPLLLLSDSSVFSGGSAQRYREDDAVAAVGAQAESLAHREMQARTSVARHIILRTGPIISAHGSNALTDMLSCIRAGGRIGLNGGPRFCPTLAADVARVIGAIVDQLDCGAEPWGIYHYQSTDPIDGFEFGEAVLAAANQYWDVAAHTELCKEKGGNNVNALPLLQCQRIRDTFGIQQLSWRKALPTLIKQIHDEEKM